MCFHENFISTILLDNANDYIFFSVKESRFLKLKKKMMMGNNKQSSCLVYPN